VQNNFGQVLDDVTRTRTRYVVNRRGVPQAVVLSFDDFVGLLNDDAERQRLSSILKELRPAYNLGESLDVVPSSQAGDNPSAGGDHVERV
jgi:prevent-host-death family protein